MILQWLVIRAVHFWQDTLLPAQAHPKPGFRLNLISGFVQACLALRAPGPYRAFFRAWSPITDIVDRSIHWPEGFTNQRLAGSFTLEGKARWKRTSSRVSPPSKDEMGCCMLIGEGAVLDEI